RAPRTRIARAALLVDRALRASPSRRLAHLCAAASSRSLEQRHEADLPEPLGLQLLAATCDAQQLLTTLGPDRRDETPTGRELLEQRIGQGVRCGRNEDRIVGRVRRPTLEAVSMPQMHVADVQLLQAHARA